MKTIRFTFTALLISACCLFAGAAVGDEERPAIGSKAARFTFKDIRYLPRSLNDFGEPKVFAIAFLTNDCPLARRYLPRLQELSSAYQDRGVQFIGVNVGVGDSVMDVAYQAIEFGVEFPVVKDFTGEAARALGATRTPEVVLLDGERVIRFRGRIDEQYRLGGVRPTQGRQDLKEAIDELLAGRAVSVPETPVDGCVIEFPVVRLDESLTYARDIAPLINKHCVECHRPGTAAPFSLTSYARVSANAEMIAEVVEEQRMPPWFAHPAHGDFINKRGLDAEERETIIRWVRSGKAPGNLDEAPKVPEFSDSEWLIGEPDLVVTAGRPEQIPALGFIPYRYVILPHIFTRDTYVQGIQIMPGNPKVVHHANLAHVTLTGGFDATKNFITGFVPGGIPISLDSGNAIMIPAGSALALQIHYVTTGKDETDQISVGLRFAKEPVRKRVRYKVLAQYGFEIPPGVPAHRISAQAELEGDSTGLGLFSHMHLRGKDSTFFARYPDGSEETLLSLPNYNFDWQLSYLWEPGERKFPKGTVIECRSHFDNSPFNPYNPDPDATVKEGPQTHDEMMQAFFFYTNDAEELDLEIDPATGRVIKRD